MATISIPPELERAMVEQANRQGTALELLSLDKLNAFFLPVSPMETALEGETMAGFLKEFIGCIDSRMDALMAQYTNVPMDLADASLVAAAECHNFRRIFTIDSDFYISVLKDGSVLEVVR